MSYYFKGLNFGVAREMVQYLRALTILEALSSVFSTHMVANICPKLHFQEIQYTLLATINTYMPEKHSYT